MVADLEEAIKALKDAKLEAEKEDASVELYEAKKGYMNALHNWEALKIDLKRILDE